MYTAYTKKLVFMRAGGVLQGGLIIESELAALLLWWLLVKIRAATRPCACGFGVEVPRGNEKFVRRGGRGIFCS